MSSSPSSLVFPRAQRAQIIRANQRDLFHVSSMRDQTETVLRSWLGTRRLTRWDKEVDVFVKLVYYSITTGRATQTLGEEYTDIWQYAHRGGQLPPSFRRRVALIVLSVLPTYALAKVANHASVIRRNPELSKWARTIQRILSISTEINLALFYLGGVYYDPIKRLFGIQQLSSFLENPHTRPPSYSLLGVMIGIRLAYRLIQELKLALVQPTTNIKGINDYATVGSTNAFLDDMPISQVIKRQGHADAPVVPPEEDEGTALDVAAIPEDVRQARNCTLCLEGRTDSCVTECGHLFCWNCIVGWGREKAECPLCRQSLVLSKLLPVYNL